MSYMSREKQVSITLDYEVMSDSESDSDCVSSSLCSDSKELWRKVVESSGIGRVIKMNLLYGLGSVRNEINVVAIHSVVEGLEEKKKAFKIFLHAVVARRGCDPNRRNAWYGGSRGEIHRVLDDGFRRRGGLSFSPIDLPLHSAKSAKEDVDGVRHMLLCRMILGKLQIGDSMDFDSSVDNTKYVVWNADLIAHIVPCFIVTFTAPSSYLLAVSQEEVRLYQRERWDAFMALKREFLIGGF